MEGVAKDTASVLQVLLPGFLSAWIFYGFTPYTKPAQFERVVQALVFTFIVRAIVFPVREALCYLGRWYSFGIWDSHSDLSLSALIALLIGVGAAYSANNDDVHSLARRLRVTRETSYPSEWFGVFNSDVTYIVLHLHDERRVYGWPREWPSDPSSGHFVLEDVSWLKDGKDYPITGVQRMLINVKDVKWVEFMNKTWEVDREKERESAAT